MALKSKHNNKRKYVQNPSSTFAQRGRFAPAGGAERSLRGRFAPKTNEPVKTVLRWPTSMAMASTCSKVQCHLDHIQDDTSPDTLDTAASHRTADHSISHYT